MGATPVSALNLVAFSLEALGEELLREILRGGAAVAADAEVAILGGHSIDDPEPKYGMAVTGIVHPDEVLTNAGGRAGDLLVLTKPLGAGAVSTAVKRNLPRAPLDEAVEVMTTLNRDASAAARAAGVHALTDVTGFGLLGHLHELALASGLAATIDAAAVPAIDGVLELLADEKESAVAGGTRRNRAHAEEFSTFADRVPEARRWLVCDAMTSGGLLAAVPAERADLMPGSVIGQLVAWVAGLDRGQLTEPASPSPSPSPSRAEPEPSPSQASPSQPRTQAICERASGKPTAIPPSTPTASEIQLESRTTSGISATTIAITAVPIRSPSMSSPARTASRSGIAQATSIARAAPLAPRTTGTSYTAARRRGSTDAADQEQQQHHHRAVAALEQPSVERDRPQHDEGIARVVVGERRGHELPPVGAGAPDDGEVAQIHHRRAPDQASDEP